MKILSIGNSFSQDAQRWLHRISEFGNTAIDAKNLYIGGCSLERHYNNIINDLRDYDLEGNNIEFIKKSTINEALSADTFDVITIQQVSDYSGLPQTYFPYLAEILKYVKQMQPNAKICFHRTWSYEENSPHGHFFFYDNNPDEMSRRIGDCMDMVSKIYNLPIIPTGAFISYLVKDKDISSKKIPLYRDGFHLSYDYGRFSAACLWYKFLTGETADWKSFATANPEFDISVLGRIIDCLEIYWDSVNQSTENGVKDSFYGF